MASTSPEQAGDLTQSSISLESISSSETLTPYSSLTPEQIHMVKLLRASRDKSSWRVPFFYICSSAGKLVLGFSVSLAIKGHYDGNRTTFIVGIVLATIGLLGCIAAALGFGAAASQVNKKRGLIFKVISISGACLIGLGYAINQWLVSTAEHGEVGKIRLSYIPLMFGTGLMSISLPNFTAYCELVYGSVPLIKREYRAMVALGCFSPALGNLFAGWVTGEHSQWPPAFNAAVLTFAIALALVGVALNWSDNLRYRVSMIETQLSIEEAAEQKANMTQPGDPEKIV